MIWGCIPKYNFFILSHFYFQYAGVLAANLFPPFSQYLQIYIKG